MKKFHITPKQQKKVQVYIRAGIQLLFFLFLPSAFTSAFSGMKYIFTQIGLAHTVEFTAFVTVLLALCAYTIVFGRFFCGCLCVRYTRRCFTRKLRLDMQTI
ncbi:MAG: hypothetical protein LUF89_04190 [Ruminococcus sp.]|nr:hypothetical protein [Ruminococcus sp.]